MNEPDNAFFDSSVFMYDRFRPAFMPGTSVVKNKPAPVEEKRLVPSVPPVTLMEPTSS